MLEVGPLVQGNLPGIFSESLSRKKTGTTVIHMIVSLLFLLQTDASRAQQIDQESASRVASASIRITLNIPPRTQLVEATESAGKLCLSRIPASQLVVSWLRQGTPAPGSALASLAGDTSVQSCVDLGTLPQQSGSTATVLIAAQ
ncbi:hypothetical protein [Microbulbifer pacificus]|uniref:Ig-like domain-containing protein n=1 Tax=Microbulbifer pacificus TaxID=407164 RepID=A0AAU0MXP2_9GAMM|nr:hypothetical protein [Microbulbifer pacificus]WOX04817.1 hypothetical protein R5R33_13855 [Microbulbifer pacificus]